MNIQKKKVEAVLFDLDGTLLDTAPDLGAALNYVLKLHNLPEVSYKDYRVESSNGSIGLLKLGFGKELQHFDIEVLRSKLLQYYEANLAVETRLFPGLAKYLEALDAVKIPWGIVTNKPAFLTNKLVPYFPEFNNCGVCYSADTFKNRKPHPEPLLRAAEALGAQPGNTLYIGDAQRDMEAAQRAGMTKVLAKYGYLTEQEMTAHWDVDFIALAPEDLMQLLPTT